MKTVLVAGHGFIARLVDGGFTFDLNNADVHVRGWRGLNVSRLKQRLLRMTLFRDI